ncbi:MAG: TIGR02466 family protein [Thiotrichales bacterium]|nr:TIGR02466 family protein [Thiotrichales bacterium]
MNHIDLFGIPLYEVEIPEYEQHRERLTEYLLSLREQDGGVSVSNHGGWHSGNNLFEHGHPDVVWLVKELYKHSFSCVKQEHENESFKLDLKDMWVNINEAGDWNAPHVHVPRNWSGVFYAKVNDSPKKDGLAANEGDLLLFNPLPLGQEYNRHVTKNYSPRSGYMILFPSYLLHMVVPHREQECRISIAFNFNISM